MNIYELIGKGIVFGFALATSLFILYYVVRYCAVAYALIYAHCINGKGTKAVYKKKSFWRIRLTFKLFFSFGYVSSFLNSTSISSPFYYIDLEPLFPRVTLYNPED